MFRSQFNAVAIAVRSDSVKLSRFIFNVDGFLLLLEKAQEIVNLFGVVLDGAGGQFTALTMEGKLISDST